MAPVVAEAGVCVVCGGYPMTAARLMTCCHCTHRSSQSSVSRSFLVIALSLLVQTHFFIIPYTVDNTFLFVWW